MKKTILAVLIVVAAAFAQGRGYGGFVLSYMMPDLDALNEKLADVPGMATLDDYAITYGGGGWGGGKHLMFGGWFFTGGSKLDGDSVSIKMNYSGGFFEPGYFINIFRGFGIMPSVGIGGTTIDLKLRPKLGDVDFDTLLVNPGRTSQVYYTTFTVAPTLTIIIPIEFVAIQIKGGYMYSPFQGNWELEDGADLRNAPEINPSGIYAQAGLLFGGGSDSKARHREKESDEE